MKSWFNYPIRRRHQTQILVAIIVLALGTTCTPTSTPAVQVSSGWQAQRYAAFNLVWASLISPSQVDALGPSMRSVVNGGYVTTDRSGQARMTKGSTCTVYVFQSSGASAGPENISTCTRGSGSSGCTTNSTAWLVRNCPGISAVTLPATIHFSGTAVTIIESPDPKDPKVVYAAVIVSEGSVHVTPEDTTQPEFDVQAGQAAYAVTAGGIPQGQAFFGFDPGLPVDFGAFTTPIELLGEVHQIQSANLLLSGEGLAGVPLAVPFQLGLRWLDEKYDDSKVSQAIAQMADWNTLLNNADIGREIPLLFETQGTTIDLRAAPYDPKSAIAILDAAGYAQGQEIILAYDETIPGVPALAAAAADALSSTQRILVSLQGFNPDTAESVLGALEAKGLPTLVLGGF